MVFLHEIKQKAPSSHSPVTGLQSHHLTFSDHGGWKDHLSVISKCFPLTPFSEFLRI